MSLKSYSICKQHLKKLTIVLLSFSSSLLEQIQLLGSSVLAKVLVIVWRMSALLCRYQYEPGSSSSSQSNCDASKLPHHDSWAPGYQDCKDYLRLFWKTRIKTFDVSSVPSHHLLLRGIILNMPKSRVLCSHVWRLQTKLEKIFEYQEKSLSFVE